MHSVVWIYCRPSPFITAPQDTVSLSNLLYVFIGKRKREDMQGQTRRLCTWVPACWGRVVAVHQRADGLLHTWPLPQYIYPGILKHIFLNVSLPPTCKQGSVFFCYYLVTNGYWHNFAFWEEYEANNLNRSWWLVDKPFTSTNHGINYGSLKTQLLFSPHCRFHL